jgi:hypothetical protein
LARFDGKFRAAGEAKLDIDELFSAFPGAGEAVARGRLRRNRLFSLCQRGLGGGEGNPERDLRGGGQGIMVKRR